MKLAHRGISDGIVDISLVLAVAVSIVIVSISIVSIVIVIAIAIVIIIVTSISIVVVVFPEMENSLIWAFEHGSVNIILLVTGIYPRWNMYSLQEFIRDGIFIYYRNLSDRNSKTSII